MPILSTGALYGLGGAAPGGWVPTDLGADLRAWYKGDDLTGSDGDQLSAWDNAEGTAGRDFTQSGSARPNLEVAELNGMNVVKFDATPGVQSYFIPASGNFYSGASAASFYCVIKALNDPQASGGRSGLMRFGSEVSGGAADAFLFFADEKIYAGFASTVRKTVGNPGVSFSSSWRILEFQSASADWRCYIDGGAGGSSGGTSPFFSTGTNTVGFETVAADTRLGSSHDGLGSSIYLDGWIAEAIFTNALDGDTNRQKIEGYLAHKWGLTGNLDTTHPYKSVAP